MRRPLQGGYFRTKLPATVLGRPARAGLIDGELTAFVAGLATLWSGGDGKGGGRTIDKSDSVKAVRGPIADVIGNIRADGNIHVGIIAHEGPLGYLRRFNQGRAPFGTIGPATVLIIHGHGDGRQDAEYGDDHQQLDKGKAFYVLAHLYSSPISTDARHDDRSRRWDR